MCELTISDHFSTYVQLKLSLPVHRPQHHTFRDFYNFDSDSFTVDLQSLPWHCTGCPFKSPVFDCSVIVKSIKILTEFD